MVTGKQEHAKLDPSPQALLSSMLKWARQVKAGWIQVIFRRWTLQQTPPYVWRYLPRLSAEWGVHGFLGMCERARPTARTCFQCAPWWTNKHIWNDSTRLVFTLLSGLLISSLHFMHLADALKGIQAIHVFISMCSLGIEPTTFSAANAMLYHWATGTINE